MFVSLFWGEKEGLIICLVFREAALISFSSIKHKKLESGSILLKQYHLADPARFNHKILIPLLLRGRNAFPSAETGNNYFEKKTSYTFCNYCTCNESKVSIACYSCPARSNSKCLFKEKIKKNKSLLL